MSKVREQESSKYANDRSFGLQKFDSKKHLEIGSTSCCSRQNRTKVQQKLQINKHAILRLCKKMAKKFTD